MSFDKKISLAFDNSQQLDIHHHFFHYSMMVKSIFSINLFFSLFFILHSSVISIDQQCDEKIFILITNRTILLVNFDTPHDYSPSIIYQTKFNTTIEYALFHQEKNTIILLINQSNEIYSILTLNVHDDIYQEWIEKSNKLVYSSYVYIALGQRYLYLFNRQTMLLQIFTLPLTSSVFKENYLTNLPMNERIIDYLIDEKFQYLWILFEHQLYICQLKFYSCQLNMNIDHLTQPIQFLINWNTQQFYLYSRHYLLIFQYSQNQTDYSISYFNSTRQQFLILCERKNVIEYISINDQRICYQTCRDGNTIIGQTNRIERLSSLSNILYCSKQRRFSKIILLILIFIDLGVIVGAICWLTWKYLSPSNLTQQISNGISAKEFVTYF